MVIYVCYWGLSGHRMSAFGERCRTAVQNAPLGCIREPCCTAFAWYRLAAEQGDASAQNNLGFMYGKGRGVTQDYVQAHKWYNLAASRLLPGEDRDRAAKNRDTAEANMTPAQVTEAQRLAREWKPK